MDLLPATSDQISRGWGSWGGAPIVTAQRCYAVGDVEGLVVCGGERVAGLITWCVAGETAEIVSLEATPPRRGVGARLLAAAEAALRGRAVRRVQLVTTNDNAEALRFLCRHGYRLVRVHLDALTRTRRLKPLLPLCGRDGVALRDLWELAKVVVPAGAGAGEEAPQPQHALTILAVADLARAASFYREALGWPARVEVPVYVELELPDGRGLGLYQREGYARNTGVAAALLPAGAISGTEIYLRCDALEQVLARFAAAGARPLSALAPRDWGDEAAYFADPDGNVIVVARPLEAC